MNSSTPTDARRPTPLVSVGLPVQNGEAYLSQALDSLIGQDLEDFELIISDNASTDRTRVIASQYANRDARIRYVRHDTQRGAAANFNYVARRARGRYFKWMAHDDVCGRRFLSRCVEVLERDPQVVLCHPEAVEVDEEGVVTRAFPPVTYAEETRPHERARSYLSTTTACLEAYGVMRRDALLRTAMIGPYTSSDRVFLLQMALSGRFVQVPGVEFYCRTHPQRSLRRHGSTIDRRWWFDAPGAPAQWLPRWRLTAEYGRAILRAPIPLAERWFCFLHLTRWVTSHRKVLGRELGSAGLRFAPRVRGAIIRFCSARQ